MKEQILQNFKINEIFFWQNSTLKGWKKELLLWLAQLGTPAFLNILHLQFIIETVKILKSLKTF